MKKRAFGSLSGLFGALRGIVRSWVFGKNDVRGNIELAEEKAEQVEQAYQKVVYWQPGPQERVLYLTNGGGTLVARFMGSDGKTVLLRRRGYRQIIFTTADRIRPRQQNAATSA